MSDTLSKDEVDALLRGMGEGDVPVGEASPPRGTVQPYDLVGEERLARRRFPLLDLVHERFARRLRATLTAMTGTPPTLQVGTLEMLKFATFRNRLPAGASLHVFSMAPLRGQALLAITMPLAFGLVDRVCGGAGHVPTTLEARDYSVLERQMIQRLVTRALADLGDAWTPLHPLTCAFVRTETNPSYLALTGHAEMVLALELACDLGSGPAPIVLAVPYAVLEPLRAKLGEPQSPPLGGSDRDWRAAIAAAVRHTEVTLSAELGAREVATRDLLRLRVGDTLGLGARGDDPVTLRVEGVPLMTGLAGVSRGQNAVRVLAHDAGE